MPEISRFFGIIIIIDYNEHNPPHFHVEYDELARDGKALKKIEPLA